MNKFKAKEEIKEDFKTPLKENKIARSFMSVFSGSFLTRQRTMNFLPFILFLSLMAIGYIANGYYAEEKIRQLNQLNNQLKELHSEYIISKSDLMFISKQSEVAKSTELIGIKESVVPPKKIIIKNNNVNTVKD